MRWFWLWHLTNLTTPLLCQGKFYRSFTSVYSTVKCRPFVVDETLKVPVISWITHLNASCPFSASSYTTIPLLVTYCKNHYTWLPDTDPAEEQIFQIGPHLYTNEDSVPVRIERQISRCCWGKAQLVPPLRHLTQLISSPQPACIALPCWYIRSHKAAKVKTNRTQTTRLHQLVLLTKNVLIHLTPQVQAY